jgi:hypothetical protein
MNYELAKKLKDAVFPQGTVKHPDGYDMKFEDWTTHPKVPTLSELIEACGDNFDGLIINRGPLSDSRTKWSCAGNRLVGLGETPEEAVANLWLKLNEK